MRTPRVFTRQPLRVGSQIELEAEPGHHLARVLRAKPGRVVEVFNGDGQVFSAEISSVDRAAVTVEISGTIESLPESPLSIELGIAVPANDRMDWLLQKATELGVHVVTPLLTERSQSSKARASKRRDHWQRVTINACEQSGRARLPNVSAPAALDEWLQQSFAGTQLVMLPDAAGTTLPAEITGKLRLLVGPEGGFSEAEVDAVATAGFQRWQLGPRVLRSETAPLAAIAILQFVAGDF